MNADNDQQEEKVDSRAAVKAKLALMLRRKVGSQTEDKDFDKILRQKYLQIFVFSMLGLVATFGTSVATWSWKNDGKDSYYDDPEVNPDLLRVLYLCQAIVSSSTMVTIVLITQKYQLLLMLKRAQWCGRNVYDIETTRGDAMADAKLQEYFTKSYSFWKSHMKYKFLAEVLIHLPHPVMWMATVPDPGDSGIPNLSYKLLQIAMFFRLYLIPSLLHLYSAAYINRFEVVCSDRDLLRVGFQIRENLTLKILFYQYTAACLVVATILIIIIFGYDIFVIERIEGDTTDPDAKAKFGGSVTPFWFTYVTLATVGYGEFAPVTAIGRVIASLCALIGISTFTIFSAVLVSRVSLTKEQKYGVEYLNTTAADQQYREAAANLIKTSVLTFLRPKLKERRKTELQLGIEKDDVVLKHKSNRLYHALKMFRQARRCLEGSFMQAEDTVVSQKLEVVSKLAEALKVEVEDHNERLTNVEEDIQMKLRELLNRIAHYDRLGFTAV